MLTSAALEATDSRTDKRTRVYCNAKLFPHAQTAPVNWTFGAAPVYSTARCKALRLRRFFKKGLLSLPQAAR
jgi:hypothetical protein